MPLEQTHANHSAMQAACASAAHDPGHGLTEQQLFSTLAVTSKWLQQADVQSLHPEIFKPRRPEPPCEMYNPPHPSYEVSCPNITAYICATNGLTYQNECFYCLDKWEFDLDIKVKKDGKCS
ncbi:serine protease inhibitor Kazal-type 13-like [Lemur catta]|uniref:serine protease inhibitor Kazal-type 13-like n=1 Tax=Lemur catta TaxID=9447 RepID=UPI001E26BF21|nr:serine protease inhibitor Kazal-type 13-like [Lemur catta]